jgi:hypothetical protein
MDNKPGHVKQCRRLHPHGCIYGWSANSGPMGLQHDSLSSNNIDKYEYAKSHQTPSSCQILVKLPHGGLGGILNEEPGEQTSDVVGLISGSVMWESLAAADLETHTHSIAAPVIATHCSAYRFVMQLHSATASGRGH